jgi:ribosomal-protein-alanine N-acetyltransferase
MSIDLLPLATPRLRLRSAVPELAEAVADYQLRNLAHFARWDPPRPAAQVSADYQRDVLGRALLAQAGGHEQRWYLALHSDPERVIGNVTFANMDHGPQRGCTLGYALDAAVQGQGLMHEALQAALAAAFGPDLNRHRIQAAYRPENARSAAVLQRLGFRTIGMAQAYLFIDGAWRDHVLTERINPAFETPAEWSRTGQSRPDAPDPT